jgi:hypothetical protein
MGDLCLETVGPVWKLEGETCVCVLPAAHVEVESTTDEHRCSCGTWWYSKSQVEQ